MNEEELLKQGRDKQSKAIPGDWRLRHNAFELLELPPPPQCEIDDDDFTVWLRNNADALLSAAEENAALCHKANAWDSLMTGIEAVLESGVSRDDTTNDALDKYIAVYETLAKENAALRAEIERLREAVIQLGARG